MNVGITGGAGFIGFNTARYLASRGFQVVVLDDFSRATVGREDLEKVGAEVYEGDVRDAEALRRFLSGVDAVIHLAALVDVRESEERPEEYWSVNVEGTRALLAEASRAGVRKVVFASSAAVYGDLGGLTAGEEVDARPKSFYGLTKRVGEELCRFFSGRGVVCVALRIFNVYGEYGRRGVIYEFARRVLSGLPVKVYGDGNQTRDFVYVGDVARAFEAVIAEWSGGFEVFNVASGRCVSVNELVRLFEQVTGKRVGVLREPARPEEIRRSCASTEKAARMLGFRASTSLEEGVRRVVEWVARYAEDKV